MLKSYLLGGQVKEATNRYWFMPKVREANAVQSFVGRSPPSAKCYLQKAGATG